MSVARLPGRAAALAAALALVAHGEAAPARPQILGIAHVRLQTADLAVARRFYAGVLGLSALRWDPRAGVAVFSINPRQRLILRATAAGPGSPLIDVGFETASVSGMREWLADRGVMTPPAVPDPEAGGQAVTVVDPDGHDVLLVEERPPSTLSRPAESDYPVSKRLLHAGFVVSDARAADRLYRDVLGFSEIWRSSRADSGTNWIDMQVPDGTDYLEYAMTKPPGGRSFGVDHHIALLVPDMQTALARIRERTLPGDMNHLAYPRLGRSQRLELNLYDPDGTRIELVSGAR